MAQGMGAAVLHAGTPIGIADDPTDGIAGNGRIAWRNTAYKYRLVRGCRTFVAKVVGNGAPRDGR